MHTSPLLARPARRASAWLLCAMLSGPACAADLDGAALSPLWALPFAGMLLSIAVLPLVAAHFWHQHFGKVAAGWALMLVLASLWQLGAGVTGAMLVHTFLAEYVPFVVLLGALFTVAGGIGLRGNLHGSPGLNTGLLAVGAVLASVMGTTGASMLLIGPLLRANDNRRHVSHVVVFFIFIVGNAGGSLTPLGDPPLFLGFLNGVSFFWTLQNLLPETFFLVGSLLGLFFCIDTYWYRREGVQRPDPTPDDGALRVEGLVNLPLLGLVVALVLMSGLWKPGITFHVAGTPIGLQQLVRDLGLLVVAGLSLWLTPKPVRTANQFSWAPMEEVAKLFIGIFVTMAPVLAMLKVGTDGPFGAVARAVTGPGGEPLPGAYFWLTGVLSAFLDNAPTYLVFFNLAGGDAQRLMTTLAPTLAAISAGAVFMGAATYIGNAPNFMIKAIAEHRGIRMPGFFGYMLWSGTVLLPLFGVMTLVWFR